jgi:phage I-like protein
MPNPLDFTNEKDFIAVCIPKVLKEGTAQDDKQASAMCFTMWRDRNKKKASQDTKTFRTYEKLDFEKLSDNKKEQWIKIFPLGKVFIEKYNEEKDINDEFINEMLSAFKDEKLSKPKIDAEHDFGISYGDILQLEKREDGLYAKVLVNDLFYDAIKNRHYTYISPAFGQRTGVDKTVYPNALSAISLVNYPALEGSIGDLQSQIKFNKFMEVNMNFEQQLELLNAKVMEIEKVQLSKGQAIDNTIVKETFELAKQAISKISELEKTNKDVNDKLLVKESELKLSKDALDGINKKALEVEADKIVKQAIEDGQIHPALLDKKVKDYILNKDSVLDELKVIPKIPKEKQKTFSGQDLSRLSDDDYKVIDALKLDRNDPKVMEKVTSILKNEEKGE